MPVTHGLKKEHRLMDVPAVLQTAADKRYFSKVNIRNKTWNIKRVQASAHLEFSNILILPTIVK